jgi:hypothetical protein
VAAILHHVAAGVALAEPRGNDGRSPERKIDLTPVGVAGERQRDALRDLGEKVGVVGEGDRRDLLRQAFENGADVGSHLPQVADSDEEKVESFSLDANVLVLEHPNARGLERLPHPRSVVPVVVIAEDRVDAERRLELREKGSGRFRRTEIAASHPGDHVVSGQENDVGPGLIDARHDLLERPGSVERRAHVEIAE